jgi:hypothetical protein
MVKTIELVIFIGMDKDKLVELINKKVSNKVFTIDTPFYEMESVIPSLKFKIEVVGQKEMISVGEWKPYIVYDMYIYPLEGTIPSLTKRFQKTLEDVINMAKEQNITIEKVGGIFYRILRLGDDEVSNFTQLFGMGNAIIRNIYFIQDNKINESYILEGKYDGVTRDLVRDIIDVYKNNEEGEFSLPEDFSEDEITYDFGDGLDFITIELEITKDETIDDFFVDGEIYYQDDQQTIIIQIIYNPKLKYKIIENLIGELNDTVRHEIEHIKQHQRGDKFPKEPKKQITYYTQKHQIEALVKGFKRRAKVERRPVEDVMRSWFQKYKVRHNLTDSQVEKVIKKLLTYSS